MKNPQLTYLMVKGRMLKIKNKKRMITLATSMEVRFYLGQLSKKKHSDWKGRKLSLFADYMISYVENPKESTRKTIRTKKRV